MSANAPARGWRPWAWLLAYWCLGVLSLGIVAALVRALLPH